MCRQVQTHQMVIALVDAQAPTLAQSPPMADAQMNRATAMQHLMLAQQILASLSNGQVTAGGDTTAFCSRVSGTTGGTGTSP